MKHSIVLMFIAATLLFAATASRAQDAHSVVPPRPPQVAHRTASGSESINTKGGISPTATATCSYTFTNAGPDDSYLQFCVTVNGNIASFTSPSGYDQLDQGSVGEGYGFCDNSTGVAYYDWADEDSGNWNAPVLLSSTSSLVKIERTTSDGLFTLTQTIAKQTGTNPYAKVTMALKNNTNVAKGIFLLRYADVDPLNIPFADTDFTESFDSTNNSAWGYTAINYTGPNYAGWGMMIKAIGVPTGTSGYSIYGVDQNTPNPPDPCAPAANFGGVYQPSIDGSVEMYWDFTLGELKTATVNAKYELF